jgi:hypothetical protein
MEKPAASGKRKEDAATKGQDSERGSFRGEEKEEAADREFSYQEHYNVLMSSGRDGVNYS